jgi:agmatinase
MWTGGDEIQGNRLGCGSPMQRAAEIPWFTGMVRVGIRGLGSGTPEQHDDARAWGSRLITMDMIDGDGVEPALAAVPADGDCFLSIDLDGLDPTAMPAVNMPTPGGLSYRDVLALLRGVAARRRIVGAAVVEFAPTRDPHGLAAITASRLALTVLGLIGAQSRAGAS